MALKIDITDEKGVKTRYHKIKKFEYKDGVLLVKMSSYVNQATRDAEKEAVEINRQALQYDRTTDELRDELDQLGSQITPNGEGDEDIINRVKELSNEVNERVTNPNRPQYVDLVDKAYGETDVELPYFEPLTFDGIYAKLSTGGRYTGAESV